MGLATFFFTVPSKLSLASIVNTIYHLRQNIRLARTGFLLATISLSKLSLASLLVSSFGS